MIINLLIPNVIPILTTTQIWNRDDEMQKIKIPNLVLNIFCRYWHIFYARVPFAHCMPYIYNPLMALTSINLYAQHQHTEANAKNSFNPLFLCVPRTLFVWFIFCSALRQSHIAIDTRAAEAIAKYCHVININSVWKYLKFAHTHTCNVKT